MMELKDTIEMMNSSDYEERFKAEYFQLKIRMKKLENVLIKHAKGILEFTPTCPIELLQKQMDHMSDYLECLEERANIEGINLDLERT